jgi:tetratricopeptide (TPR) repeat protein
MWKPAFAAAYVTVMFAAKAQTNLGHIEFPTSGSQPAQEHFIQGMLLLHNFEYDDAREEFQAASKLQPDFAMAYWGEALTHTYTLWMGQDMPGARAALQRLAPTSKARLDKAPTEREKDYMGAVEVLYGGGDKAARDRGYAEAMGRLRKKYPDDFEAASLYALALLGTCEGQRDFSVYMRAAAVAEEVFAKNPQHPGAIHYLIHAYDDPIHAPLGLRPARVYAKVAGSASHAQHMPSHIFFALGMWDEAIAANELSVAVADGRMKRKGAGPDQRNYHALLWLEYAYLQEGRNEDAQRVLAGIEKSGYTEPLPQMRAVYSVETEKCDSLQFPLDSQKVPLRMRMPVVSAQGFCSFREGKTDQTRSAYESAKVLLNPMASAGHADSHHASAPEQAIIEKAFKIMVEQLQAEIWVAEGKTDAALELLARTTTEEDSLSFESGPSLIIKPAHELYGEELLAAGRPKEATKEFRCALLRAPKRAVSLKDLARAEAASGDITASQATLAELRAFWHGSLP